MLKLKLLILTLLVPFIAFSQSYYKYDWKTGNSYNIYKNNGSTSINGFNSRTGKTWRQRQNSNGSYNGIDSNGNYYNGNNKTGYYYNSGTGKSCYGKGVLRTCY